MTLRSLFRFHRLGAIATLGMLAAALPAQVSLTTVVELAQQKSTTVQLAQADLQKAGATYAESRDAFIPSIAFGSGLPAFQEIGFTGSLPTIWDASVQSMVFSMSQIRLYQASKSGILAAESSLKDARERVALDASADYIELDTVTRELDAAHQQESYAARLVSIAQQRTEAGVDPLSQLLQAQLTAAELKLARLHLETRSATLAKQLSNLTGLPAASILPDHGSIPEVPSMAGENAAPSTAGIDAAREEAHAKLLIAKGDEEREWTPQIAFGVIYNRNTTLLNTINRFYKNDLPANNLSSGFSISLPIFDAGLHARAHESAADALRARIEADQAQHQYDLGIARLNATLRELDAQAEVASLKQQIAGDQLKTVLAQLEVGNGAGVGPGAPPQLSPTAEQQARIDERQKYEDALESSFALDKARLNLVHTLGHMQDWLDELHAK